MTYFIKIPQKYSEISQQYGNEANKGLQSKHLLCFWHSEAYLRICSIDIFIPGAAHFMDSFSLKTFISFNCPKLYSYKYQLNILKNLRPNNENKNGGIVRISFIYMNCNFEANHSMVYFLSWALFTNFRCKKGNEGGRDLREDCRE